MALNLKPELCTFYLPTEPDVSTVLPPAPPAPPAPSMVPPTPTVSLFSPVAPPNPPSIAKPAHSVTSRQLQTNQQAIERHLDDHYYRKEFQCDDFVVDAGTPGLATKVVIAARSAVVSFPPGANTSAINVKFRRPSQWVAGKARVTILYGGSVGSTNNISWYVAMNAVAVGDDYSTLLDVTGNVGRPGPAAANTLATPYTFDTVLLAVDGSHRFIDLRIARIGGDTYAGDAHLHLVEVELVQTVREAHV